MPCRQTFSAALLGMQNEYKQAAEAAKADFNKLYPDGPPKSVRKAKPVTPKKDRVKRPPTPYNVRPAVQLAVHPARSLRIKRTAPGSVAPVAAQHARVSVKVVGCCGRTRDPSACRCL